MQGLIYYDFQIMIYILNYVESMNEVRVVNFTKHDNSKHPCKLPACVNNACKSMVQCFIMYRLQTQCMINFMSQFSTTMLKSTSQLIFQTFFFQVHQFNNVKVDCTYFFHSELIMILLLQLRLVSMCPLFLHLLQLPYPLPYTIIPSVV